jgi:hypothetical protein
MTNIKFAIPLSTLPRFYLNKLHFYFIALLLLLISLLLHCTGGVFQIGKTFLFF